MKVNLSLPRIIHTTIQPEFPGAWIDVLRIQSASDGPTLTADVRVYRTPDLPIVADFDVTDVLRLWVPLDRPPMAMHVRVYAVEQ